MEADQSKRLSFTVVPQGTLDLTWNLEAVVSETEIVSAVPRFLGWGTESK